MADIYAKLINSLMSYKNMPEPDEEEKQEEQKENQANPNSWPL